MQSTSMALASALFFLSGATGLAYEVVWFKRFSHVWGTSTFAISSVVACFLLGLAVGAHLFGRIAGRVRSPLRWYAFCEGAIGLLALAIPWQLGLLLPMAALLEGALEGVPGTHAVIRLLLTFVVIGPPCVLMGGTLPLLVRQVASGSASADRPTAWIYAVNTIGAATGCYVTGFHLLPTLGLAWTNTAAAILNGLIALVALVWARDLPAASREETADDGGLIRGSRAILLAAALAGAASLSLQMIWNRQLALILGGSTYAFTAMLVVILIGIGTGSLLARAVLSSDRRFPRLPGLVILSVIVTTLAGQYAIVPITQAAALLSPLRISEAMNAAVSVGASAALELAPALAMGILFPLFVHLTHAGAAAAPRIVGQLYAWNTAGTIVGTLVTPLFLVPWLGSARTLSVALVLYALAFVLVWPVRRVRERVAGGVTAALAAASILVFLPVPDPLVTNFGSYLYGYKSASELARAAEVVFFREGAAANVLVTREPSGTLLRVNGKIDASDQTDMAMQLGLAYFPRLLRPEAERVLVIGHGSGTTPGASLLFPDTSVVTCEIEPAIFEAATHFAHVNHRPETSPRFEIVFDDGRSYLQRSRERFDLILSEPSNPWMAGVSNLFTREFYEVARARLAEDGLFAQWIQTYAFTAAEYALVARTLIDVFPHHRLIRITDGDTILVASNASLEPSPAAVEAAQSLVDGIEAVRNDLGTHLGSSDVATLLLAHTVLDEAALARLVTGSDLLNTDRNMRLEFEAPRHLFRPAGPMITELGQALLATVEPSTLVATLDRWPSSPERIGALRHLSGVLAGKGLTAQAIDLLEALVKRVPGDPGLLADRLTLVAGSTLDGFSRDLETIVTASDVIANRVGITLWRSGKHAVAAALFERLVEVHPQSVTAWNNLAMSYRELGRRDAALAAFGKALELDPLNEGTEEAYRALSPASPQEH